MRRIAIVGMAPSTRELALGFERPEWEVWGLNTGYLFLGDHWDRWYEVHNYDWLKHRPALEEQKYFEFLAAEHDGRPIYVPQLDDRIAAGVQYPLAEIVAQFGQRMPDGKPLVYFQSTVDWMLAHAIYEYVVEANQTGTRPDYELAVVGVDMALGDEYAHQRPSAEYWIGLARGLGITVNIPDRCDLMKIKFVYGIDSFDPVQQKLHARRAELEQQLNAASQTEAQARDRKMMVRGGLETINWLDQQRYS